MPRPEAAEGLAPQVTASGSPSVVSGTRQDGGRAGPATKVAAWADTTTAWADRADAPSPADRAEPRSGPIAGADRRGPWAVVVEAAAAVCFLQWHGALRHWVAGGMGPAVHHGLQLIRVERGLHVFFEGSLQALALRHHDLERLFGWYYGSLHLAVPILAAAIARARALDWYRTCRRAFVLMALGALAVFWLWPLAPPRLMPAHFGFVDVLAHDVRLPAADHLFAPSLYNGVAAMPSLHVGFAIWAVVALWPVVRRRPLTRALLIAHPCLMLLATMATGNHYLLDGVAGAALLAAAFGLEPAARRATARLPRPRAVLPAALIAGAALIWVPVHAPAIMVEDLVLAVVAAVAIRRTTLLADGRALPEPAAAPLPALAD